jgi:Uma2 family endonuclease
MFSRTPGRDTGLEAKHLEARDGCPVSDLVVEVMDSSASYDREVKIPLYARFGIPETWMADVEQGLIEMYREPNMEGYRQVRTLRRGEYLSPQTFPELILAVDQLLGSA